MSLQDPIADMLTRMRNALAMHKVDVSFPASKIKIALAEVLRTEGYIIDYKVEELGDNKRKLIVFLKYYNGKSVIEKSKRVSKPSLRVYKGKDQLPKILGELGVAIISTPKGVMSDRKARSLGLGGEVLCYVY